MTEQPATEEQFTDVDNPAAGPVGVHVDMEATPESFDDGQRERLAALAECLIAGGAGMPSAREAEVHQAWVDRALGARPDLRPVVEQVLELDGEPQTVIDALQSDDPQVFGDFAFVVTGAYLINPRVRKLLGYPAGTPAKNPAMEDEAEAYLEDGILDVVIERGPIYRSTPDLGLSG